MKLNNGVIIASLKSESTCKQINRIPGPRLLISSLPGSALRTHVESLSKPWDVNKRSQALPGNLDIKRRSPSKACAQCTYKVELGMFIILSKI